MTKADMEQLSGLLNRYLVEHCASEKVAEALATVRNSVNRVGGRMIEVCPWCGEMYTAPHPQCQIKRGNVNGGFAAT